MNGLNMVHMKSAWVFAVVISLFGCGSDGSTANPRAPRNTYADYQHISGYVRGVWTKENNPYIISGVTKLEDGDSLVITEGVRVQFGNSLDIGANGTLIIRGTENDPVVVLNGDNIDGYRGRLRVKHCVFEGGRTLAVFPFNSIVEKSTFVEVGILFTNIWKEPYDSLVLRDNIIAGGHPWDSHNSFGQIETFQGTILDSSKTKVDHNIFFTAVDDSFNIQNPLEIAQEFTIVRVFLAGKLDTGYYSGPKWPYGENYFAKPKWVKYRFIGPVSNAFSTNDYHLIPGSFGVNMASDGGNIGAY